MKQRVDTIESGVSPRLPLTRPSSSARLVGLVVPQWSLYDLRNIILLIAGFLCVLFLVSPAHDYSVTDDWTYFRAVGDLLRWHYKPLDSQALAFSHVAWGTLFAYLFGYTYTALTASTLVLSAGCLIIVYLLFRRLGVSSGYALLGAAMLGLNPMYVYLSYSFMTDVPFVTYMLAALLCYVIWFQKRPGGDLWMWLGGVAVALAYLTRQFGLLVLISVLLYMWWSGQWSWRKALQIVLLPAMAGIGYAVWEHLQSTSVTIYAEPLLKHLSSLEYVEPRLQNIAWTLSGMGLYLLPLLQRSRRVLPVLPFLGFFLFYLMKSTALFGSFLPANGNVVDYTGLLMVNYQGIPLWSLQVWTLIGALSVICLSLYGGRLLERAWTWLRSQAWRERANDPALAAYATGVGMAVVMFVLLIFTLDRYLLPIMPALMLPALRSLSALPGVSTPHRVIPSIATRWALLAPVALFTVLAQRDYKEHAAVRWGAATRLAESGIAMHYIDGGGEWVASHLIDEGTAYSKTLKNFNGMLLPSYLVLDPVYVLTDNPSAYKGYSQIDAVAYHSWLEGGSTHWLRVLKRDNAGEARP